MKITKAQLKQIVLEEATKDPALLKAISALTGKIEDLDVSIDYLASAVTGKSAFALGGSQAALGRLASKPTNKKRQMEELKTTIEEELGSFLGELGAGPGAGMNLRAAQLGGTAKRDVEDADGDDDLDEQDTHTLAVDELYMAEMFETSSDDRYKPGKRDKTKRQAAFAKGAATVARNRKK
jgi:hypothetical protein